MPLSHLRLRFRKALRPATQAEVAVEVRGPNALTCTIRSNEVDLVTADATLEE